MKRFSALVLAIFLTYLLFLGNINRFFKSGEETRYVYSYLGW